MASERERHTTPDNPLTREQEELLNLYIQKLDSCYEQIKNSEKVQVEIETMHLKKILSQ
jgi:hypothetical protein